MKPADLAGRGGQAKLKNAHGRVWGIYGAREAERTRLSQDDFATAFGFTINQIKDWEQGRACPLGGVRAYLLIIERDAKSVLELLKKARGKKVA